MSGEIHEECGVFGIYKPFSDASAAYTVYTGLLALQHRGQESCGIAVGNGSGISMFKDNGLVEKVFTPDILESLGEGKIAVGHVRYGTSGGSERENAQPILTEHPSCTMALVHNGNLVNSYELRHRLERLGDIFHTTSDTEIISYIITRKCMESNDISEAMKAASDILEGAYSLIILLGDKLVVMRDRQGFRPLCYGITDDGTYIAASESCALDACDAKFVRDVKPGEIIIFDGDGVHSVTELCGTRPESSCIFEYIYFARPDSVIDGCSVHNARVEAGKFLALDHPADADVVIGVPDSGLDAAIGFSRQSGIPYGLGFIKNKYIGRTFISPGQGLREHQLRIKLNTVSETVSGKRVVMVDDSIVRGTTCARIVGLLREAGAREVHVRITAPPFLYPCYYGTDVNNGDHLIAVNHSVDEICKIIGADSLGYLDISHLTEFTGREGHSICRACFDGRYKTLIPYEDK